MVIIDLKGCRSVNRLINIYRSFNPQDNVNARAKFKYQLELIKNAMTSKCVIVGDFNMDYAKIYDDNYNNKNLFQDFDDILSDFNLIQLVKFETWSRMVGTERRSSILDHIYIKDPTVITKIDYVQPFFGDHVLVEFIVDAKLNAVTENICRDWRNYSKDLLCDKLSNINWDIDVCEVQQFWNVFENLLIKVIDEIVPMTVFWGNAVKNNTPRIIL